MQGQLQLEVLCETLRKHYIRLTLFSQDYHLSALFLMFAYADTDQLKDQLNVGGFFNMLHLRITLVNIIMSEW